MSDDHSPFPPPSTDTAPATPQTVRLHHPAALFALAAGLGGIAALVVGLPTGALVMAAASSDCTQSDGWCELGAAVFGLFAGLAIGAIAYIVTGVMTIARCRPTGRRSTHVLVHIALPLALIGTGAALINIV